MRRKNQLLLDKKDKELLYWLDVDARTNYSELAKKIKVSKQLVKYRIERLEKEKFIKGYYPMIDQSRLGLLPIRVYIKLTSLNPNKRNEIIEYLKKQKNVWAVVLISGKWDLVFGISVEDISQYYEMWDIFLEKYINNIKNYASSIYAPIYHYASAYLINKNDISPVRVLGGGRKSNFDKKDIQLLIELSKNARLSLLEISNKIKLSPKSIRYRIKQLETKGIIQGYRAMIDVDKLGYQFYKAEIRLLNYKNLNELLSFCHAHPNIYQVDKTIGGETFEIELHVKSVKEMLEIIGKMEEAFPNTIGSVDYFSFLSQEKITFMPEIKISTFGST